MSVSKYVALGCMASALLLGTAPALADVTHTTSNLNLRAGPGTNYPVRRVIPAGAPIDVQSCGHIWCYALWASHQGYVGPRLSLAPCDGASSPDRARYDGALPHGVLAAVLRRSDSTFDGSPRRRIIRPVAGTIPTLRALDRRTGRSARPTLADPPRVGGETDWDTSDICELGRRSRTLAKGTVAIAHPMLPITPTNGNRLCEGECFS